MTGPGYLERLLRELTRLPAETEWVEFKENNADPDMIGKTISALSNSATLNGQDKAYMVWGVRDVTHEIVGTTFQPGVTKSGNENLEAWLVRLLDPRLSIKFHSLAVDGMAVVILEIPAAARKPTRFSGEEKVRVGSTTHSLRDHGDKEAELWRQFDRLPAMVGVIFFDGYLIAARHGVRRQREKRLKSDRSEGPSYLTLTLLDGIWTGDKA